jgi:putative peptidoglycan lipid II flippase
LMWLALGLPAHVLVKALSPAFFAREDTITPLWATLKGMAIAIVAGFVLGRLFGASGIAAAIALGAWSSALSLIRKGAATFGFSIDAKAQGRLPRIALAALAMGALLWLVAQFTFTANTQGATLALVLLLLIAVAIAVYGLALARLGVTDWRQMLKAARPSAPNDLRA